MKSRHHAPEQMVRKVLKTDRSKTDYLNKQCERDFQVDPTYSCLLINFLDAIESSLRR